MIGILIWIEGQGTPVFCPSVVRVYMKSLTAQIKARAHDLGFDPVGVAPAEPPEHWAFYLNWLERGCAGEMGYLSRNLERRADPRTVVPGAKSVVCVGMNYEPVAPPAPVDDRSRGKISRYARGDDYHDVMAQRLFQLLEEIQGLAPSATGRVYVDTGPVLERDFAARAGLGWFGKHTNLIHKEKGSWFFLGEIILTVDLDYDSPVMDHCGTCTLCMEACPTDAIPAPYVLDSTRCISYLTIELKGAIPRQYRTETEGWIYGCDICQEVCPWNQKQARPTGEPGFQAREGLTSPDLVELLEMDQAAFSRRFKGSPIKRAKRRGLLRNAAVALGNLGREADVPALAGALCDPEPLVRGHAAWALGRIGGDEAGKALEEAMVRESDDEVCGEIRQALEDLRRRDG